MFWNNVYGNIQICFEKILIRSLQCVGYLYLHVGYLWCSCPTLHKMPIDFQAAPMCVLMDCDDVNSFPMSILPLRFAPVVVLIQHRIQHLEQNITYCGESHDVMPVLFYCIVFTFSFTISLFNSLKVRIDLDY